MLLLVAVTGVDLCIASSRSIATCVAYVMAADEGLNSASITKAYSYVVRQREGLNSGSIVSVAVLLLMVVLQPRLSYRVLLLMYR